MPGRIMQWPPWTEYGIVDSSANKDPDFSEAKRAIVAQFGADNLKRGWVKVCEKLKAVTDEIVEKQQSIIPIFDAATLLKDGFSERDIPEVKRIGVCIVRGVIPQKEVDTLYAELQRYLDDNKKDVKGWPAESPSMLMLYDTPTQNKLRTNPAQLQLQRMLNELWHDETGETSPDPLIYLDGMRDRPPGQPFLGLGPHVDAGSLCRWVDPAYIKVYEQIFSGYPEKHDSWNLGLRKDAIQDLFQGPAHSSTMRSFQGWTALTQTAPKEGTLLVYPNLEASIAYMMLRPFFKPPADSNDTMDASKWVLDESGFFPGTMKPESQRLSRSSHPHLRLEECLLHVPPMQAGDTVWWHADVCHAVDPEHLGSRNASVAYIAACPSTPTNKRYVKQQLADILAGRPAPDYADGLDQDETRFKGYVGHVGLSAEARRAFGYHL